MYFENNYTIAGTLTQLEDGANPILQLTNGKLAKVAANTLLCVCNNEKYPYEAIVYNALKGVEGVLQLESVWESNQNEGVFYLVFEEPKSKCFRNAWNSKKTLAHIFSRMMITLNHAYSKGVVNTSLSHLSVLVGEEEVLICNWENAVKARCLLQPQCNYKSHPALLSPEAVPPSQFFNAEMLLVWQVGLFLYAYAERWFPSCSSEEDSRSVYETFAVKKFVFKPLTFKNQHVREEMKEFIKTCLSPIENRTRLKNIIKEMHLLYL